MTATQSPKSLLRTNQGLLFDEEAAPATPAANKVIVYAKTDGKLYSKDDAGAETALGGGGALNIQSVTSAATVTPDATNDCVDITAQAVDLTIANPTGTPTNFQKLLIRVTDNGTARSISWDTNYLDTGVVVPFTTIAGKTLVMGFMYNTANALNAWQLIAIMQEP